MVRAKVDALRLTQVADDAGERDQALQEFETYLALAESYAGHAAPTLTIMRGVSGSGKSTVALQLVDREGAIRIRSDVERKRLYGIDSTVNASAGIDNGIYSEQASVRTYARLAELAQQVIEAGYPVVVDAAFLRAGERREFHDLAERLGARFRIVEVTAAADELRRRIAQRSGDASDADLAVLEHQLAHWQPLEDAEREFAVTVDNSVSSDENQPILVYT